MQKQNYHFNMQPQYNIISNSSKVMDNNDSLKYHYSSDMNYQHRKSMEDLPIIVTSFPSSNQHLLGVLDGHGGKEVVGYVQKAIQEEWKKENQGSNNNPEQIFKKIFKKVDAQLKLFGSSDSGSTVCLCSYHKVTNKTMLTIANLGDSRAVIGLQDGSALRITKDHKATDPTEQDRVKAAGGMIYNNRVNGVLAITRALGDYDLKQFGVSGDPDIFKVEVRKEHKHLIMGCDGIWDVLDDQTVVNLIHNETDPEQMTKLIIKKALQMGTRDNLSVLVIIL